MKKEDKFLYEYYQYHAEWFTQKLITTAGSFTKGQKSSKQL